jgi:hypothetical protein
MRQISVTWHALLIIALLLALVSCGSGGGGGGGGTPGGDPSTIPTGSGTGSKTDPAALTVGATSSDSIGLGGESYYSFIAPATGEYTIVVSNATTTLSWVLYSNSGFTSMVEACGGSSSLPCYVHLTGGATYYLTVNNFSISSGTFYTITVSAGGGNEGSIASPVQLVVGTPYNATINSSGDGYYYFMANRDGSFVISLTNTHTDLSWSLSTNASYTSYVVFQCNTTSSAGDEACSTTNLAAGLPYYLKVHNRDSSDDAFTITVSGGASEGSMTGPVHLAVGTSHAGGVGANTSSGYGASYYTFTTDATNTSSYNIVISNMTPTVPVGITVYPDTSFSYGTEVKNCYASAPCLASALAPGTAYYVKVSNADYGHILSCTYSIVVTPGDSEGSPAQPVGLLAGQARNAVVDGHSSSYYAFTTANNGVGGSYTIGLTNTNANLGWTLYSNAGFSTALDICDNVTGVGAGDETCVTTNLDPNTTYYVKVSNNDATLGSYALLVAAGGGNEGSRNYPYSLPTNTAHSGSVVRYGNSYYKFTTGSTAMAYRFSLTQMQTSLDWRLYSDAGFTMDISPVCSSGTGTEDRTCSTTQSSAGVLNAGATYYLKVESNVSGNIDSTYNLEIDALDPAAGCSAGATECLNFQSGVVPAGFVLTSPGNQSTKWSIDANNNATTGSAGSSMKSGGISTGQSTCFEYTRTGTAELLFSFKANAASVNSLTLYINGNAWRYWYGNAAWRRVWYGTPNVAGVGSTVYKWCYETGTTPVANEAVWVDDIEFR